MVAVGPPHASYQSGGEHNMYPCNCKFTGPEVCALAWCSGGTLRPYSDLKALTREIENEMKVEVRSLCPGPGAEQQVLGSRAPDEMHSLHNVAYRPLTPL